MTDADTFWWSLFSDDYLNALGVESSNTDVVPHAYYESELDENYGVRVGNKARHSSNHPMIRNKRGH